MQTLKRPTPLCQIECSARLLSESRADLTACVDELNSQIEALKRKHLPGIKRCVAACAAEHADLTNLIDANRDLFVRPRTHIFHGIKLGIEKSKGKLVISDPDRTLDLIDKIYDCDAEMGLSLQHIERRPNKEALAKLPVADLKRLGCTIEDTGDQILIKFTDSAVDKAVKALLKDAIDDATEKAA